MARVAQEAAAGGAQFDLAAAALEQRHAQVLLQQLDLARQRRLRHAQALGGAAEVQFLGHGDEAFELAEFHRSNP
ncbi:hypothetical protein ABW37_27645 [Achromobacter xylosoxidans]|nr:hypothetical protein ABW37_27645 [Achromobacter xylosoxidans]